MGCCSRDLALITDTLCGLKTLITRVGNTFLKLMGLEADVGELGPQRLLETTTGRERRKDSTSWQLVRVQHALRAAVRSVPACIFSTWLQGRALWYSQSGKP